MFLNILTSVTLKGRKLHVNAHANAPTGGYGLSHNVETQGDTLLVMITASYPKPGSVVTQACTTLRLDVALDVPKGIKRIFVTAPMQTAPVAVLDV